MNASHGQLGKISALLREAEFDTRTVTLMYRRLGVDDSWNGQSVDTWLKSLTRDSASRIITKLEDIV